MPHRTLTLQDGGILPAMRPPIFFDTTGLDTLTLAQQLLAFTTGNMMGREPRTAPLPVPALVGVDTSKSGHLWLIATCPAVQAVFPLPLDEAEIMHYLHIATAITTHQRQWFSCSPPPELDEPASKIPDVSRMLLALHAASTYEDAATLYGLRRPAFNRALTNLTRALGLHTVDLKYARVYTTLDHILHALDSPLVLAESACK